MRFAYFLTRTMKLISISYCNDASSIWTTPHSILLLSNQIYFGILQKMTIFFNLHEIIILRATDSLREKKNSNPHHMCCFFNRTMDKILLTKCYHIFSIQIQSKFIKLFKRNRWWYKVHTICMYTNRNYVLNQKRT